MALRLSRYGLGTAFFKGPSLDLGSMSIPGDTQQAFIKYELLYQYTSYAQTKFFLKNSMTESYHN